MTKNVFFEAGGGSSRLALVGSLIAPCWPPPNRWTGGLPFPTLSLPSGWHGAVLGGGGGRTKRAARVCLPAIQAAAEQTNIQIVIHMCYSIMHAGCTLANVVFLRMRRTRPIAPSAPVRPNEMFHFS